MKKQTYSIILLVLVSMLVLFFTLKDDFTDIVDAIAKVNIWWFLFSCLLVLIYWYFQALCLSALASTTDKNYSFLLMFKAMIMCHLFSAITPSATGGQPFQIYYLKKKGVELGTASNLVVEQSTLFQIALVIMAFAALILNYFFNFFPSDNLLKNLVIIGFIVNSVVIAVLLFISFGKKSNKFIIFKLVRFLHKIRIIKNEEKMITKLDGVIENFYNNAHTLKQNKTVLIKGVIYNFIGLSFLYIIPITVAYSLGDYISLNPLTTLVSSAYVMLIGAFIPIPGGSGGVELAFASFFGTFITGPALMAMLLIWRFITFYLAILIGGLVLAFDNRRKVE